IHRSGQNPLGIEIPLFSAVGVFDVTTVSFAIAANGNGYGQVLLQISTNGGATFTQIGATQAIPNGPGTILTFTIPAGTTLNIPLLVLRLDFVNGQSNGTDLQNQIDNIQINGTIVPEPATVAGGLFGVLGLCWFQRRRLIRSVRLGRTYHSHHGCFVRWASCPQGTAGCEACSTGQAGCMSYVFSPRCIRCRDIVNVSRAKAAIASR